MKNFIKKHSDGFTLIETMLAIAILIIVAMGGVALLTQSQRLVNEADDNLMAINYARDTMELLYFDDNLTATGGWDGADRERRQRVQKEGFLRRSSCTSRPEGGTFPPGRLLYSEARPRSQTQRKLRTRP